MPEAFPVSVSRAPLVADTLPALKTAHFVHGEALASRDVAKVYTYARLYALGGGLRLSLFAFERQPAPESRVAFAFGGNGGRLALVTLAPGGAELAFLPREPAPSLWPQPAGAALEAEPFAGVDEQGWYWGAQLALSPKDAAGAGCDFTRPGSFYGALYKYRTDNEAFGCSVRAGQPPLDFSAFGRFEILL